MVTLADLSQEDRQTLDLLKSLFNKVPARLIEARYIKLGDYIQVYNTREINMNENAKRSILNNLSLIADRVEGDWDKLTNAQLGALNAGIEALWQAVCKRGKVK